VAHVSLRVDLRNSVAFVTLDRPHVMNALDGPLIGALTEVFGEAGRDSAVRAVVLAGEGKAFSAGADINWMRRMGESSEQENFEDARRLAAAMRAIDTCPKPTIARIQGAAFGGALGLIACCDVAIAVPSAVFAVSEVRLGIIPSVIAPYLIRAVGSRAVRRLTVTAERITAEEALRLGLVHEIVDAGDLDAAVERQVNAILAGAPAAIAAAKALVADLDAAISHDVSEDTARRIASIRASDEAREGLAAFLERRKPRWVPQ
jgi:methylglutaconyl-CoA hydratase